MKNSEIYNAWWKFIEEYNEYFKSSEEIWYENLEKLKTYLYENKKKP